MCLRQGRPVHLVAKEQIGVRCVRDRHATAERRLYLDVAHLLFAGVGAVEDNLDTAVTDASLFENGS